MMADEPVVSELERCLAAVVSELREQSDLAHRLKDGRFRKTKIMLLESSLSTYQWLAVERMRRRNHCDDPHKPGTNRP